MDPFIGQIQPNGFNFAARGWALCDGQLLAISSNTALFSLLGTTFGGDGRTTFALPDLRGRSIVHVGHGPGLSTVTWGQRGGRENVTLTQAEMPSHSHQLIPSISKVNVSTLENSSPSADSGSDTVLGSGGSEEIYREIGSGTVGELGGVSLNGTTSNAGGNIGFNIRDPFLGIYVSIALVGIFPSRS